MHRKHKTLPISILIHNVFANSGLSARQFVCSLGYRNVNHGLRKLDQWLDSGAGSQLFLNQLVHSCQLHEADVQQALRETARIKSEQELKARNEKEQWLRTQFRPYIFIDIAKRKYDCPRTAAMLAHTKIIKLSETLESLEEPQQLKKAAELVASHFIESGGQYGYLGEIQGYVFVNSWETFIKLAPDGDVIATGSGDSRLPHILRIDW